MFRDREDLYYYILYGGRAGSKSFTSSIYLANRLVNGKRQSCILSSVYE